MARRVAAFLLNAFQTSIRHTSASTARSKPSPIVCPRARFRRHPPPCGLAPLLSIGKGAGESRRMTKLVPESEWDASHGGAARRRAAAQTRGHARGHSREPRTPLTRPPRRPRDRPAREKYRRTGPSPCSSARRRPSQCATAPR